jgi:RimJ/RimL family protein N-acetyltransferase
VILGDGIRLRAIEREDLPRYVSWFNDPEVRDNLKRVLPMSTVEEGTWFDALGSRSAFERPFALDVKAGGDWVHIGGCGIHVLDPVHRSAELGIMIGAKEYWHRGLGTAAMCALLRHSFDTLNLHRVYLHVLAFNERAIRLYRGLGFREEGRLREDFFRAGRYHDTLIMGLLRDEWRKGMEGV